MQGENNEEIAGHVGCTRVLAASRGASRGAEASLPTACINALKLRLFSMPEF